MEKLTLMISIIGAFAWLPTIIQVLTKNKLYGKIISRYTNTSKAETFILYRISLISTNKVFHLKKTECEIVFENGTICKSEASNMREIVFNSNEKLEIERLPLINNYSLFESDENIDGYLFFTYPIVIDSKIVQTKYIFTNYKDKKKELLVKEKDITASQLYYDNSIWSKVEESIKTY